MSVSLHALFRHCVRLFSFLKQVVVTYLCFYTALDSSILENFNERAFDSNRVAPQNLSLFACIFHDVVVCFVFACVPGKLKPILSRFISIWNALLLSSACLGVGFCLWRSPSFPLSCGKSIAETLLFAKVSRVDLSSWIFAEIIINLILDQMWDCSLCIGNFQFACASSKANFN